MPACRQEGFNGMFRKLTGKLCLVKFLCIKNAGHLTGILY